MTILKDFYHNIKAAISVVTATITADTNGTSVDMQGYKSCAFYAVVGNSGDTLSSSVKIELEIEDSPDDSTWTDAADADIRADGTTAVTGTNTGTFALIDAPAEDSTVFVGEYTGNERYVRPVINVTGTHTNGTPIGIIAVRGGNNYLPES